ncbi:unnamed protein product, partial [Mesorhabditis spiculigera]
MFDSFRQTSRPNEFTNDVEATPEAAPTPSDGSSLAWDTRIQCFAGCFILSCIASLCASILLMISSLAGFCVLTSIGSIMSLIGTCFLMGPLKQLKNMFSANRWVASLAYIAFIMMALISGLVLKNTPLALIFTILQYVAMAYYSLTYIPFAKQYIDRWLCSCLN